MERPRGRLWAIVSLAVGAVLYSVGVAQTYKLTTRWSEKEEIRFGADLRGVWLRPKEPADPPVAVLFANGATGTLEHNLPLAIELTKHGVTCFLFDFSGQGGSPGNLPREEDLAQAIAAFKADPRIDPHRVGAVGHSLGARLLSDHPDEFRAVVLFGNLPSQEAPHFLVAHSRFEFLFDRPDSGAVATGPWTDHISGPLDADLLRAARDWLGKHLGFTPVHPVTEPERIAARLAALLGGALVVLAALLAFPWKPPQEGEESYIPSRYVWMTALVTGVLPVLLAWRRKPSLRFFGEFRGSAFLAGVILFALVYLLADGFASWSYFNVSLYVRKLWFLAVFGGIFTLVTWHDQTLLHGHLVERPDAGWKAIWSGALAAAASRWIVAALVFTVVVLAGGRVGIWMILAVLAFVSFWLEGLAAALTVKLRHPLAGAVFLGLTWSWLWTVFLPM